MSKVSGRDIGKKKRETNYMEGKGKEWKMQKPPRFGLESINEIDVLYFGHCLVQTGKSVT